jgi:type I restriction enzyme, R subunit
MNLDNFFVRMHRRAVERFRRWDAWKRLTEEEVQVLQQDVAGLPAEKDREEYETRMFDLIAVNMQLALLRSGTSQFEKLRKRVTEIASRLEEKATIPAVRAQLAYLSRLQENEFWQDVTLDMLEEMRLRLRDLAPLIDKRARKVVYTDFIDEITGVRRDDSFDQLTSRGVMQPILSDKIIFLFPSLLPYYRSIQTI